MLYIKICEFCGKPFQTDKRYKKLCSKECGCEVRKRGAQKRREKLAKDSNETTGIVEIRIIKPLDVFGDMCPEVGSVHKAEKMAISKFAPTQLYIIRSIGKYGLIVRQDECEEVNEKGVIA